MLILAEQLITEFLTAIQGDLVNYLEVENRNATGRSAKSIQVTNVNEYSGQLVGHKDIEYVFRGRGPGKMPPLSAIIDWCNARGIPRAAAWIIARRIAENGTKLHQQGRNVLKEFVTEERKQEFIAKLRENIKQAFMEQVKVDLQAP